MGETLQRQRLGGGCSFQNRLVLTRSLCALHSGEIPSLLDPAEGRVYGSARSRLRERPSAPPDRVGDCVQTVMVNALRFYFLSFYGVSVLVLLVRVLPAAARATSERRVEDRQRYLPWVFL